MHAAVFQLAEGLAGKGSASQAAQARRHREKMVQALFANVGLASAARAGGLRG
jgi:hypothetical protein